MQLGVYSLVTPDCSIEQAAELVADVGYTGIEWTLDYPKALWDGRSNWHIDSGDLEGTCRRARQAAARHDLTCAGLGATCNCHDADRVRLALRAAALVGARGVRVHSPDNNGSDNYERMLARAREAFASFEQDARRAGVRIWIEVHCGRLTMSASATRRLLDGLDPEWIGAIFDPGNMIIEGMENWRSGAEILGPYLQHVHVKSLGWFRGDDGKWSARNMSLPDGMVDWPAVIGGLKRVGYDGFLDIEDFRGGYARVSPDLPTRLMLQQDFDYLSGLL